MMHVVNNLEFLSLLQVAEGWRPALPERWPPGVTEVIRGCWEQHPADRWSMDQVVQKLEALQQDDISMQKAAGGRCRGAAPAGSFEAASCNCGCVVM